MANVKINKEHKYIYHLYTNEDHEVHLEKHSIIYMNSVYVYFKISRKNRLGEVYIKRIHNDLSHLALDRRTRLIHPIPIIIDEYLWSCTKEIKEVIEQLKQQADLVIKENKINMLKQKVEYTKQQYQDAMRELNDFMLEEDSKS